jgi:hypothetical protein
VDSTSVGRAKGFDAPFWVMMRSMAVPGWGQATNGKWIKAVVFAGAEGALLTGLAREDHLREEASRNARNRPEEAFFWNSEARRHRENKRDYLWWTAFTVLLSVGDAYVDAHLRGFQAEFREEDSAVLLSIGVHP